MSGEHRNNRAIFLPDFCNVRMVFIMVMLAELLAFILALGPREPALGRWLQLSMISLFIQWVVLTDCALLCLLRPYLQRASDMTVALSSMAVVATVTLAISEISFVISRNSGIESLLPSSWHGEFLVRNLAISVIIAAVALRYFYVQNQLQQSIEARAQARIQVLQARIRPHFLFNSMNTIASLTRTEPALAEEIVEDLADLFRVSLHSDEQEVPIGDELQLCRRYLHIEQTRLGDRLRIDWSLQEGYESVKVPALSLQPLLENAIYHGIEPRVDGGVIHISSHADADRFYLSVRNPLPPSSSQSSRNSHHMALQNIRDRLNGLYGELGDLRTERDDEQFTATLVIPLRRPGSSS